MITGPLLMGKRLPREGTLPTTRAWVHAHTHAGTGTDTPMRTHTDMRTLPRRNSLSKHKTPKPHHRQQAAPCNTDTQTQRPQSNGGILTDKFTQVDVSKLIPGHEGFQLSLDPSCPNVPTAAQVAVTQAHTQTPPNTHPRRHMYRPPSALMCIHTLPHTQVHQHQRSLSRCIIPRGPPHPHPPHTKTALSALSAKPGVPKAQDSMHRPVPSGPPCRWRHKQVRTLSLCLPPTAT